MIAARLAIGPFDKAGRAKPAVGRRLQNMLHALTGLPVELAPV